MNRLAENDRILDELASRYVLFSCEGTAEGVVIERLASTGSLVVPTERIVKDPLTFKPFTRLRKAKDIEARFFMQDYAVGGSEGLLLARIVDSRNAQFSLSRIGKSVAMVRSFITAPEIEMLIVHAEGAYSDWLVCSRRNRQLKPSDYCKQHLGLADIKREAFLRGYWADEEKLVRAIRAYAKVQSGRHASELTLADLLARR